MFRKLSNKIAESVDLPIEISDLADALVVLGCQDEIIFSPQPTDPGKIKGIFYKYTTSKGVYRAPDLVTLIVYSSNVSLEWQRVICAKEIVHVCDGSIECTRTEEQVSGLLDKILGPLATEDFGMADFMASIDKLALYQGLDLLFPMKAREMALKELALKTRSIEEVVDWVSIPKEFVELVLDESWPQLREIVISI